MTHTRNIIFSNQDIGINDVMEIATNQSSISLSKDPLYVKHIDAGATLLEKILKEDGHIYGVTTGYGDSVDRTVPAHLIAELPLHLTRFHGCGLGQYFSHKQTRAIMVARLCSLAKGNSGVSYALLQQIVHFLNHDISPLIPEEGSVGASGDLTPLSYVAAALIGERFVSYQGKQQPALKVLRELNLKPITLRPKEGLAIMNGTAVMTAIACEAYTRTVYLCKLASRLTAMCCIALKGNTFHFDEHLFAVKPHPGQIQIAAWIRSDFEYEKIPRNSDRLQSRYSIRCAPHVIGVVQDSLSWFKQMIENELNSTNDNPIIDVVNQQVLHGGHFYGGHIASVMDTMKTQIANLADLLDRQMALLVDTRYNSGLPANLSFPDTKRASINHGFKAVQIGMSAWTAEALKNTMPASVFSRSTECHNQDKVSMGTIAARDCLRILQLTEQVFAAHILATAQAIAIRINMGEFEKKQLKKSVSTMLDDIVKDFELVTEDRPLDETLRQFVTKIQQQHWRLYE